MDSVKCPICTGEITDLGDRPWIAATASIIEPCPWCDVDIRIRRVKGITYEALPAPDEVENG